MGKQITDQFLEDIKSVMANSTKQIKFFQRDELKQVQDQVKVTQNLDGLVFDFQNPEITLQFGIDLITTALKSTDRVPNSYARQQLKKLALIITHYNQIDDDIKEPDATKFLLFSLSGAFIYLYDDHIIKSRIIKDRLIINVQAGALESAMLLDEIRTIADDNTAIDILESQKRKKKNK